VSYLEQADSPHHRREIAITAVDSSWTGLCAVGIALGCIGQLGKWLKIQEKAGQYRLVIEYPKRSRQAGPLAIARQIAQR
jgi:hypothetical protein